MPSSPSAVVISASAVTVVDESGANLLTHGYLDLTAEVVADFTALLGTPNETPFAQTSHSGAGIEYDWDGLAVLSQDRWAELDIYDLPEFTPRWFVKVTAPAARGVEVRTVDGISVGDPTAEVEARFPDAAERFGSDYVTPRVDFFLASEEPSDGQGREAADGMLWRVWLIDEEPEDVIQDIRAPSPNYGA